MNKTKKKNLIQKIIWRLKFRKIKLSFTEEMIGRCINCDAGKPLVECSIYYCPCSYNQH